MRANCVQWATFEGIDMAQVNSYKAGVIDRLYKGLQGLIKSGGITVVEGEGRLVSTDANGGGVGLVEEGIDRHGGVCDRIVLAIAQHGVRFRARVRATAFGGGCLVNHRAPP